MYSGRGQEGREQLGTADCQSEGHTETDNGQIARGMVKRQRGTHTETSSREEKHTIQEDKRRVLRDKTKGGSTRRQHSLCPKQNPMHGFGASAKRQDFL